MVREVGVPLIGLPPGSPEPNPAEGIIGVIRGEIEGRVYEHLEAKRAAAEGVLKRLGADPEAIRRLAGWTWIREADAQVIAPI